MINKTILIAAGGTGGHVFPGIAVAHELQSRGYDVQWLGCETGLESRLVPVAGLKLNFFPVKGIRGKGGLALLLAPFRLAHSLLSAIFVLKKIKPALVVGMGGFVSGPAGLAAYLLGVPLVIHEQNAIPGTTNRLLSKIAAKVLSAFPISLKGVEVIGNPIRRSLEQINKIVSLSEQPVNILVLGGSRGAKALNMCLAPAFVDAGITERIKVKHQCGSGREDEAKLAYGPTNIDVEILPFIDDMDAVMQWADLIVCRAGALTVSEVAMVGLPSVLIPYPYAIDDHQTKNAEYLAEAGGAIIVQETEFDAGKLSEALQSIVTNNQKISSMAVAAKVAGKRGATNRFVDACEALIA